MLLSSLITVELVNRVHEGEISIEQFNQAFNNMCDMRDVNFELTSLAHLTPEQAADLLIGRKLGSLANLI